MMAMWLVSITLTTMGGDVTIPLPQPATQVSDTELAAYHQRTRAAVDDVLEMPEFADLRRDLQNWWVTLLGWLKKVAESIAGVLKDSPGWLWWTVVIWLVLTLVAILAHFAYVLYGMIVSSAARRAAGTDTRDGRGELFGIRELEFDSVYQRALEFIAAGDWAQATKYLYVAAILWLDRHGWVGFKVSKTNYDYLTELSQQPEHRAKFRQLTNRFESTVYGGEPSTAAHCQEMASQLEVLLREATPVVSL